MDFIRGFKNVISFLTILPVRADIPINEVSRYAFTFPIVGLLTGGIAGIVCYLLKGYLPDLIVGTIGIGLMLLITGLHHTDGLLDFGDGLMYQGTFHEKLEVMKDNNIGTGGFSLGIIVIIATLFSISYLQKELVFTSLIIAEVSSKLSLVLALGVSSPVNSGIGKIFIESFKSHKGRSQIIASFAIGLAIAIYLRGYIGVLVIISILMVCLIFVTLAKREFGGVNGDILGAIHEISRLASLMVLLVA